MVPVEIIVGAYMIWIINFDYSISVKHYYAIIVYSMENDTSKQMPHLNVQDIIIQTTLVTTAPPIVSSGSPILSGPWVKSQIGLLYIYK
mgnify:CR=1 FL=1